MTKKPTSASASNKNKQPLPGLSLTARDIEIINAVYEYRALTAPQVEALFFPKASVKGAPKTHSNCQRRLRLLTEHGFLLRIEQEQLLSEGRKPLVYFLAKHGAEELAVALGSTVSELDWRSGQEKVGRLFLDHLLATNSVRIAVTLAARRPPYQLVEWRDDKTLKREHATDKVTITGAGGATKQAAIVPDGYFVLDIGEEIIRAFLEVDRRTVTGASEISGQHDWARKIRVYREYFRPEGLYEQRYGTKAGRVLTVTTGERRLDNLKRITEEQGGKSRYWFTTQAQATTEDILRAPIWAIAGRAGVYPIVKPHE